MRYSLEAFVSTRKNLNSAQAARNAIGQFLVFVYPDDEGTTEEKSVRFLEEKPGLFDSMQAFVRYCMEQGNAPNTVHWKLAHVKSWLAWNGQSLTPSEQAILKTVLPRRVTVHNEGELTREKLVSIVSQSDVLLRAVLLILISSGMRVGECLSIRKNQVEGNEIHMEYTQMKGGKPHVYFISREALQALDEWYKVRDKCLGESQVKIRKCLRYDYLIDSSLIFPYVYQTIQLKFNGVLKKAQLYEVDKVTNRSRLTIHMIRKYTDSTMCLHISKNMTNALIGHFEKGDSAYRRYTREQLREAYKTVEPYLSILAPAEFAELQSETRREIATHDKLIVAMMEEKIEMKHRLEALERIMRARED